MLRSLGLLLVTTLALAACGGNDDPPRAEGPARTIAAPSPEVNGPRAVGSSPAGVAVAADAVWVVDRGDDSVSALDPSTAQPLGEPIEVGGGPFDVALGEGAVWVIAGDGTVWRIDPRTRRATRLEVRVREPAGIAAGGGSVWVTSRTPGSVSRIDPRTGRVVGEPVPTGRGAADVVVGAGSVWVANTAAGTVSRLDAATGRPAGDPVLVGDEQVLALAFGEGGLWVAKTDTPLADPIELLRLDPDSGEPDGDPVRIPGAIPVSLAAGAGAVWATDVGNLLPGRPSREPAVIRIDPESSAILGEPIPVGANPTALAAGPDAVWVASGADGTVTRIAPRG
jgi:DNA-binding beta-propeller fold protein YncE